MVFQLYPLLLPRRRAHSECCRRAESDGRHNPVVRELCGVNYRQVRGFGTQALGALGVQ
jgi:hypothetical protein